MNAVGGPSDKVHAKHLPIKACVVTCIVLLGLGCLWIGLSLGGRRGPTAAETISAVLDGSTTSAGPQTLLSATTDRSFARLMVKRDGHDVGSAVIVSFPNPEAATPAGRLLGAPKDLTLCIVLDASAVVRGADVLGLGGTIPGVSRVRQAVTAWTGFSVFELTRGGASAAPEGGQMTDDLMVDLGRTLVGTDYGDAVLTRCEQPAAAVPVALRTGDFIASVEMTDIIGHRVNLASMLGHTSLLMNCDPSCGTCFDMTVSLFTRIVQQGKAPGMMLVLMQASTDSERGRLLLKSLPSEVTVIEDPDNVVAHSMGMNVSAYAVVTNSSGRVTWCRRIGMETNVGEAIHWVENTSLGGS